MRDISEELLLEVYDFKYNLIAILNDRSMDRAINITLNKRINAIDTLTFRIPRLSEKWQYIVNDNIVKWDGEYYLIVNPNFKSDTSSRDVTVECEHLSTTLQTKLNEVIELIGVNARTMMAEILEGSGWSVGEVDVDDKYRPLSSKDTSVFSNLVRVAEIFTGMLVFHSTTRVVDLITAFPDRQIVFRVGKNVKSLNINYDSKDLVTRLYVRGGQTDVGTEVTIIGVNPTQKTYIENFSYFMASKHLTLDECVNNPLCVREMVWSVTDYVDPQALYDDAVEYLDTICIPRMSCSVQAQDLSKYTEYQMDSPILGEAIYVIDENLNTSFQAKVDSISINYDDMTNFSMTMSNFLEYSSILNQLIDSSRKVADVVNSKGEVKASRLKGNIDVLATKLNSTLSHWYTDEYGNLVFENDSKTSAMKLGGGIFGIASSRNTDGSWNWRTFGDGTGFTADALTAGTIYAERISVETTDPDNPKTLLNFIRFEDGKIVLGEKDNQINLTIDNDRISFKDNNGMELAHFSNNSFEITRLEKIQFGNFAFLPRDTGNLTFTKVN